MIEIASLLASPPATGAPPPASGAGGASFALTLADFLAPATSDEIDLIPAPPEGQPVADGGKDLPDEAGQPDLRDLWFVAAAPTVVAPAPAEHGYVSTPAKATEPTAITLSPATASGTIARSAATGPAPVPTESISPAPGRSAATASAPRSTRDALSPAAAARPTIPAPIARAQIEVDRTSALSVATTAPPAPGLFAVASPAETRPGSPPVAAAPTNSGQNVPRAPVAADADTGLAVSLLPDEFVTFAQGVALQQPIQDATAPVPQRGLPSAPQPAPLAAPAPVLTSIASAAVPVPAVPVPAAPSVGSRDAPALRQAVTDAAPRVAIDRVPTPDAPLIQPAFRAFASAIAAAADLQRRPVPSDGRPEPGLIPLAATAPEGLDRAIVQPAADARHPALDLRQERGLQGVIDRIELLRDDSNARDTRIRLVPDALGGVEIALRKEGEVLHVHFTADIRATATLIAEAQPRLTDLAEARGIKLGQTSIGTSSGTGTGDGNARQQHQPATSLPAAPARRRADAGDAAQSDYLPDYLPDYLLA